MTTVSNHNIAWNGSMNAASEKPSLDHVSSRPGSASGTGRTAPPGQLRSRTHLARSDSLRQRVPVDCATRVTGTPVIKPSFGYPWVDAKGKARRTSDWRSRIAVRNFVGHYNLKMAASRLELRLSGAWRFQLVTTAANPSSQVIDIYGLWP